MDYKNILVVGVKGSVIAFDRRDGRQLWSVHLKSSSFVSVVADQNRVYAHTYGALYCLDLLTGAGIWDDPLRGFGYDAASLALPDQHSDAAGAARETLRQHQASTTATTTAANASPH